MDNSDAHSPELQQLEKPGTSWWKYSGFHDFLSILAIGFIALCFALKLQAGWLIGGLLTFAAFQFLKAKIREDSKEKTFTEVITSIAALITGFVALVFGATATYTQIGVVALLAWQALISITSFIYHLWVRGGINDRSVDLDEDEKKDAASIESANNSLLGKTGFMSLGFIGLTIFAAVTFFAPFESVGIVTLAFVAPLVIAAFFGFKGDPYAEVDKFLSSEVEEDTLNESMPTLISSKYVTHTDNAKANQWGNSYNCSAVEQDTATQRGLIKLIKDGNLIEWQLSFTGDNAERNYHALIYYFGNPEAKEIYQLITSARDNNQFVQAKQKYFDNFFTTHDEKGERKESADSSSTAIVEFKKS